jgi:hypothetical protein
MPLIDIQTNLKSLGFGNDRPYGGSSNQPYIKEPVDINLGIEQGSIGANVLGSDFLLRGGILGAAVASATDALRIGKFFNPLEIGASYNGALFITKQFVLDRQNVDVVDDRSRLYNPLSTILQVGVNAFGGHLDRTGLNPFKAGYLGDGNTGYYPVTLENDTKTFDDGSHNRLQLLYQVKRLGNETADNTVLKRQLRGNGLAVAGTFLASIGLLGTIIVAAGGGGAPRSQFIGTLGIGLAGAALIARSPKTKQSTIKLAANLYGITGADDDVNLISYGGGPGSTLGIGKTDLRIWNPLKFKNLSPQEPAKPSVITSGTNDKDPSSYLVPNKATIEPSYFNPIVGINRKYGSQTRFTARSRSGISREVNPNLAISPDGTTISDAVSGVDDYIDFGFALINNDSPNMGMDTTFSFRAYIEDFNDSFNGEWDTYKYVGRGENFYKYKGFTRDMSISFIVPALSRADMITNYQKINALIWAVMPDYSEKGLMRGQLAKFTMGDYLKDSLVVIKTISIAPIMEMGFDLNQDWSDSFTLQSGDAEYVGQLPKGIKVQCTLTPLTQGTTTTTTDTTGTEITSTYYYTPQRGEAFIGNRNHVLVDRPDMATQYGYTGDLTLEPISPESSPLYANPVPSSQLSFPIPPPPPPFGSDEI